MWHLLRVVVRAGRPGSHAVLCAAADYFERHDELILNKQDSVTRYKIIETSISASNFRIRVERVEGFDPIITGTNVLRFYGDANVNKIVFIVITPFLISVLISHELGISA